MTSSNNCANIFDEMYFKLVINYVNYVIVKSIVWQLEAWEMISGELKQRIQWLND